MGILDRARSLFRSPADRRLAAAREAEAWTTVPRASLAVPFSGGFPPPAPPQPIQWWADQMPPAPLSFSYQPGYSNHTYQSLSAPLSFEGFDLCRIHNAVATHRLGYYVESSTMMVALMGFAPVLAALQQAIAPILALPRHVHGGDKGLARMVAGEVREQLVPESGLLPSPFLPPSLWGTMAIYLRMLGFCVLQHVDGEPDPDTGIRARYTRIWEPWAVNKYRSPRKWIALTTEGPIEIKNDGHFTLVIDEQEGDLTGAIVALGDEVLAGKLTQEARNGWLDFFGRPKLYATLPEKVPTHGEAGEAFAQAVETIYGPDGRGVLPYGSTLSAVSITGQGTKAFQDSLLDTIIHIYMVLTGSAGTIGSGGPTGAGPYQPQKGGPWNVRHDLIARPTIAFVRAINQGHVAPYCDMNYGEQIKAAKRAGTWVYPTLRIPIPAPDRDERIASDIARQKALSDQVVADKAAGAAMDQDRVYKLAERFEALPFMLADPDPRGEIDEKDMEQKLFAPDEYRAQKGYDSLPNGVGAVGRLAEDRAQGLDKTGQTKASEEEGSPPVDEQENASRMLGKRYRTRVDGSFRPSIHASIHSVKFDTSKAHAVYIRDGYKCQYCGKHDNSNQGKGLSIDHIDARARGGAAQNTKGTPATNLVTACGPCNSAKQDRTPRQWNEYQKTSGQAPPPTDWSALRKQAAKPIDIKAGEKNATEAKSARDAAKAAKPEPGGGGSRDNQGDEHHPPGTPHP